MASSSRESSSSSSLPTAVSAAAVHFPHTAACSCNDQWRASFPLVDASSGEYYTGGGCCIDRPSLIHAIHLHNFATRTNVRGIEPTQAMNRFATYGALVGKLMADHPGVYVG